MKKYLLVFGNNVGKGSFSCKKEAILSYLNKNKCDFNVTYMNEINKNFNFDKYDTIVVVGGDGSILKVIPYIINSNLKLGIIPCGTANLFAASLAIPFNIEKAIDIILNGHFSNIDVGKAGNDYFALRIGIGFDADVVNNTRRYWKKYLGYLAYFIQGIISSFHLSYKSYKITIDEQIIEVNANLIIIANAGNMFRNLFKIAPGGSTNDGKLDILIVLSRNFKEFILFFFQLLRGTHTLNPQVIHSQAKSIKIEKINKNMHVDGEPYYNTNLDITVLPSALKVVIP